jgi:hypothetical protein
MAPQLLLGLLVWAAAIGLTPPLLLPAAAAAATTTTTPPTLPTQCTAAPFSVPRVPGRDQSPTPSTELGRCTTAVEAHTRATSHWCSSPYKEHLPNASFRPPAAELCAKRGRMTVYRGPVLGWAADNTHVGACNATLAGSAAHAMVAVSSRHLSSKQGAWEREPGSCGACMCVRMAGADEALNSEAPLQYAANIASAAGSSFMAVVGDRCGECEDDHIDVLLDRPLAYAPYDRNNPDGKDEGIAQAAALRPGTAIPPVRPNNRRAPLVNRVRGPRVFSAADSLRGVGRGSPEAVGVYVADWQWAPCEWTHAQCARMWRRLGYDGASTGAMGARVPPVRGGVDSDTGNAIASPQEDKSFCCQAQEGAVLAASGGAPLVSDALPAFVRSVVEARLLASGGVEEEEVVEERVARAAANASATSAAAAALRQNRTDDNEEEEAMPMYNAADEFAQAMTMSLAAGQAPVLLASGRRAGATAGASRLRASQGPAAATSAEDEPHASATGLSGGAIAGIVIGTLAGVAVLAGAAKIAWLRRAAAAAGEAGAGGASTSAAALAKPAFVMPPPPASGNGAEMGAGVVWNR